MLSVSETLVEWIRTSSTTNWYHQTAVTISLFYANRDKTLEWFAARFSTSSTIPLAAIVITVADLEPKLQCIRISMRSGNLTVSLWVNCQIAVTHQNPHALCIGLCGGGGCAPWPEGEGYLNDLWNSLEQIWIAWVLCISFPIVSETSNTSTLAINPFSQSWNLRIPWLRKRIYKTDKRRKRILKMTWSWFCWLQSVHSACSLMETCS